MKKKFKTVFAAFFIAALITSAAFFGVFYKWDNRLSDAFYQKERPLDGNIFVLGIDVKSLEELGPYQTWGRSVIADVISILNSDPDSRPAAIGVDILYTGETDEAEDQALADACSIYDNVVLASAVSFTSELVDEGSSFYMDDYAVEAVEEPFEALKKVTRQGHINAMYDKDGIMRHDIFEIDLPDGTKVPSFSFQLYEKYCRSQGIKEPNRPFMNERNQWYIPFSGKPGAYNDGYSVIDLLTGELDLGILSNSIVLIGPYAPGLMDYVTTSIDHSQVMYGVEFQANVLDALIQGDFKKEAKEGVQLILLFLASFLSYLFFHRRNVWMSVMIWLIICRAYLGIAEFSYANGLVLHVLWVPLAVTVSFIISVAANYIQEAVERRAVTNTFKHYVAPEVVNELLKNPEAAYAGGKLTDIAVLFVDIRGFTPMSEILSPTQVVEILNRYLTLTSSCIMKNQGTLDKFVGDATMAIFNAPLPLDDYIYKAVKAAWDMVEGSQALSEELKDTFGRTVSFGIGVHCGEAVVGNIGAKMRMDYTAIGDTVNTAARLEANAPGGQILISRAVADALKGRIEVTSLGDSIKLKGKAEGFEILRVDNVLD